MATSFKGWLNSWGGAWGPVTFDPNAMAGAAGFVLTASATLTQLGGGDISGAASMTFSAQGVLSALGIIEEQKTQVYGSGKKLSVPPDWNTGPQREPLQGLSEDEHVAQVLEKWDAIEKTRAPVPALAPDVGKPITIPQKSIITPSVKVVIDAAAQASAMAQQQAIEAAEKHQRAQNELALLLILAEL